MSFARGTQRLAGAAAITFALLLGAPTPAEEIRPGDPPEAAPTGEAEAEGTAGSEAPGTTGTPEPDGSGDAQSGDDVPPKPRIVLGDVTVTATRSERDPLDVPANVTVIARETIERSAAKDVPDLLRREAGVFVTNTTGNPEGYTVELRGFNNGGGNGSGTLVLVDGRRVNEPGLTTPDWSYIHLDNVERIEVVRGPVSAVHGDNAIAGVIHIITRQPEGPAEVELAGRTGTYDTDAGSLFARGTVGPVSASVFADGYKTHGYRERSDFRRRHVDGKVHVALGEWGVVGLHGGYSGDTRQRPGDLTRALMAEDRRQAEPGGDQNVNRTRERWMNAFAEIYGPHGLGFRIQGWHRRNEADAVITDPFTFFETSSENDVLGLTSQLTWDTEILGRQNRLIVGFDWLQEDRDTTSFFELAAFPPGSPAADRSRRKLLGLFLQNELEIVEDVLLTLGVRRESGRFRGDLIGFDALGQRAPLFDMEFESRFREWAPKAALTWRIREDLSVYASYAKGFRFPNIDEAFGVFGFSPDLVQQTSQSYEVGVKLDNAWATLNVAAYTMNVEHEIFFNPLAPNELFPGVLGINDNVDRVRHRGIEVYAAVRPTHWLEIYGSYTFDDTKFTRDKATFLEGNRLPIIPRHRGNAGIRAQLPWWVDVTLNGNFVARRHVGNDVANRFEVLPKFAVWDAQLAFRPPLGEHVELALLFTVRNLTNRRYTEFAARSLFAPLTGFFPSPDRNYQVAAVVTIRP